MYVWWYEPRIHSLRYEHTLTRLFEESQFYWISNASSSRGKSCLHDAVLYYAWGRYVRTALQFAAQGRVIKDLVITLSVVRDGPELHGRMTLSTWAPMNLAHSLTYASLTHTLARTCSPDTFRDISAIAFKKTMWEVARADIRERQRPRVRRPCQRPCHPLSQCSLHIPLYVISFSVFRQEWL